MDKRKKEYKKMWKAHKKELIKLAKKATPFQAEDGFEMWIEHLRFMRDYYKIGYNVWAMERKEEDPVEYKDVPTRFESLDQALKEYNAIEECEDNYIVYHYEGGIANGKGIVVDGKQQDWWTEYKLGDYKTSYNAYAKERKQHETKFKRLVEKYFNEWSD